MSQPTPSPTRPSPRRRALTFVVSATLLVIALAPGLSAAPPAGRFRIATASRPTTGMDAPSPAVPADGAAAAAVSGPTLTAPGGGTTPADPPPAAPAGSQTSSTAPPVSPPPPQSQAPPATSPTAGPPASEAVEIASGETAGTLVAHWTSEPGDGPASIALYDAGATGAAAPLVSLPAAPGIAGVALAGLDPAQAYRAEVTVSGAHGTRTVGPTQSFRAGPDGPVFAAPSSEAAARTASASPAGVCTGASYGVGAVSVDGYAGMQGSYCLPPAFTSGTGAFCVDHGLDYPLGAYQWSAAVVGDADPLVSQYDRAANPADVQRLAWVVATQGATTDPARAVAVGVITHAVMGDYPGLSTSDLSPSRLSVTGGDPGAISADVASMWSASGGAAGPYQVSVSAQPGPYLAGQPYRGAVSVTGRGGAPEASVPIDFSATTGASVIADQPAQTGPDGSLGFTFTPTGSALDLKAAAAALPADTLTLWTPLRPPVAVQRVVTSGPPVAAGGALELSATLPAQATIVKQSTDPVALPVGAGFGFDVAAAGAGGAWNVIAHRDTAADGTTSPVTGLSPGAYRVTETAHPPSFEPGGPWDFTLTSGQQAQWVLTDAATPQSLVVAKVGDDPDVPVGAGASFAVTADRAGDGTFATPVGTVTTGADGRTPPLALVPGRYQVAETTPPAGYGPASPVVVTIAPVGASGPEVQTVTVEDHVLPGTLLLSKVDAASGLDLPGAQLRVERRLDDGGTVPVGVWTTAATPTSVPGLQPGHYVISEQAAPSGYGLAAPQSVDLQPGQTLQVTVPDQALAPVPVPSTAPLGPAPAAGAAPQTPAGPSRLLAFTGLPVWRLLLAGASLLGAGLSLVGIARPRRRRRAT